jgi:cold shock CspA family protein
VFRIRLLGAIASVIVLPSAHAATECGKYTDVSDERVSGTFKSFDAQAGKGIVATSSRDYPVNLEDLERAGIDAKTLTAGAKVSFQIEFDKICRAYRAVNLRLE